MGLFDVDFDVVIEQNMPVEERTAFNLAWLKALVSPVVYLYGLFLAFKADVLYDLNHNGQVCKMEGALNDVFDNVERRITIGDPIFYDPVYVYLGDELKPVWLGLVSEEGATPYADPIPLYKVSECYGMSGVEFTVHVPVGLVYDVPRMKALIDKYRLASKKNYVIVSP